MAADPAADARHAGPWVRTPCPLPFRGWTSRDGWTEGRLASLSVLSSFVLHYLPVSAICRDVFIPPADCDINQQTWLFSAHHAGCRRSALDCTACRAATG